MKLENFWSMVDVKTESECWSWKGGTNGKGYGQFRRSSDNKRVAAHRQAYELVFGSLDSQHACHTCDNPICCNPYHIFPGDQKTNIADAKQKKRMGRTNKDRLLSVNEFRQYAILAQKFLDN